MICLYRIVRWTMMFRHYGPDDCTIRAYMEETIQLRKVLWVR